MKRRVPGLLLSISLLAPSGCTSIYNLSGGGPQFPGPSVYGGTRMNFWVLSQEGAIHGGMQFLLALIDLPLSFVLDTLLLPITIPVEMAQDPPTRPYPVP